jgi:hypothetical protein
MLSSFCGVKWMELGESHGRLLPEPTTATLLGALAFVGSVVVGTLFTMWISPGETFASIFLGRRQ